MITKRFKWETRGKAKDFNLIKGEKYRFTILTSRLIRMEYDKEGIFEDRASQHFFYRDLPETEFSVAKKEGNIIITTSDLILTYQEDSEFSGDTLSVKLRDGELWKYGDQSDNLKGTVSTLDGVNGETPLEDGLCSRNGYVVVDDSESCLLTEDGWFDIRREGTSDLYFFGYGNDYLSCIKDFYRLTGAPPLLPDYALGNWWSRFYPYKQDEYCELMERFKREEIPFSVAVIDMDWHKKGWTGYSWNTELIPDYKAFLSTLHQMGIKTTLNLHPAGGVGAHEDMYEEMAAAVGVDPESKKPVKFDCLNPKFMEHYFDILHHPYEENGVDFWWMDWQQGTDYSWVHDEEHPANRLEKINPLWLLNHLHIVDIMRNGKRPMFFSRYSGLGSHRYPVGFSGDTIITWESLDFQPYFTANASNVGYGWWSHDIGGHMEGFHDDEMLVRWMQYGVFSPINRLHSSNSKFTGKEPWNLHPYLDEVAREYLRLRHRLFPYLYTMNYRNHTELIPMVLPMYYMYPNKDNAYKCPNQYWFGSEFMVVPVTQKADATTGLSKTKVWFPEGEWIDAFNGFVYQGDKEINVHRGIRQLPIFAKKGAIVPTEQFTGDNQMGRKTDMELYVFAGADNSFTLYEDNGDYNDYKKGAFAKTQIDLVWSEKAILTINSAEGDTSLLPKKRNWKLNFRGFNRPDDVLVNGVSVDFEYDLKTATVKMDLQGRDIQKSTEIIIVSADGKLLYDNSYAKQRLFDIVLHAQMSNRNKEELWKHIEEKGTSWLWSRCSNPEHQQLLSAIMEMLTI